ncbi:MAG: twin-arginine translocase subunit TatC [Bryobacterales bacterium]|nr:twin-arginine translocase subunit TatC [Bryobacterales bacterium]
MLRMSFLGHLEELRLRIVRALMGVGVAFGFSLFFSDFLWDIVIEPVTSALREIGVDDKLIQITPMESFNILWIKLPILAATFLSSPWILYQVWAFIAPGLYKRERRWAAPFVIISAGLFILGGTFAYFIAFRYGLTFLLGIGVGRGIAPMITVSEYFNLFVNVMLTIGIVFQMPVLIFFLTLLRIVTPGFLLANSRYAILIIVIVAAIITPTPDVFNLMLFATPMCLLFFVGVFASYLLTMSRENRRIPWRRILLISGLILVVIMVLLMFAATQYGYQFGPKWPFLTR